MKFTYNWIKDYVDIKLPPEKLAGKLTMAGLEVVSLEAKEGDYVFEVEITSNRPDWLSIIGIAREVAVITGSGLRARDIKACAKAKESAALRIEIEDQKDCLLYTARIIRDIKVGPSAGWLKKRLELIGCRSVNNVVDITNYCLFELGEPLHAFDLDKLVGQLASWPVGQFNMIIRKARNGEELTTIDGISRRLLGGELVIASLTGKPANRQTGKPIALAGIMGGRESEVSYGTKNILLEAAVFNPVLIRRARQAHALQSESSYRFERGVDPGSVEKASIRAGALIREICGGKEAGFKSSGAKKIKARAVFLSASDAENVLGVNIKPSRIKEILSGLGFKVSPGKKGSFRITVPSFRQDVCLKEDLIEEVARVFGYERIPISLPKILPSITIRDNRSLISNIKNILIGLGLNEAITYSLDNFSAAGDFGPAETAIELLNPLSREQGALRTTLIPGLARAVAYNLNQKQGHVALFEVANVYFRKDNSPHEELRLAIALSGEKKLLLNEAAVKDEFGLLNLKGIAEELFRKLKVEDYRLIIAGRGERADILINNEKIGLMAMLPQPLLDKCAVKNKNVFALEVSLDKLILAARRERKYVPLAKYPSITRDISFVLKKENSVEEVIALLKEKGLPLLGSIKVVDYYKGKQIPQGCRGLTIECNYSSSERTLTEEEVAPVHELLCSALKEKFQAALR